MNESNSSAKREIRSFVIRSGRMTESQRSAYHGHLKKWGLALGQQRIASQNIFGNDHTITLEIGFGMGDSLAEMAATHPDINFVGIEVHRPGVGRLLRLIEDRQLTNLRVYCEDAIKVLNQDVNDHSINRINLFFPDPWHKTRHHKRRLVQPSFLDLVARKLTKEGLLHIATDWQPYAEHVLKQVEQHPQFEPIDPLSPYVDRSRFGRPKTKFEQRGLKLGHGVWDMVFKTSY